MCYTAEISGIVATLLVTTLLMGWGGVGCGRGACQRSLYFVHYSVLRCNDLWDLKLRYMLLRCWDLWDLTTLLVTTLLRSLGSLLRYLLLRVSSFQLYQFPNTNLSFRIPFSSFRIRLPVSEYHFPVSEHHFQFPNTSFRIPLASFRIPPWPIFCRAGVVREPLHGVEAVLPIARNLD